MPTRYGKRFIFQLIATAVMVKKVHEGQRSDTVVLVTCPLTSIIQDQVNEGKSVGLDCVAIKNVATLRVPKHKHYLYNLKLKPPCVQFAVMFVDVFLNFYWLIICHITDCASECQNVITFGGAVFRKQASVQALIHYRLASLADSRFVRRRLCSCHQRREPTFSLLIALGFPISCPMFSRAFYSSYHNFPAGSDCLLQGAQSCCFELFWPRLTLPLN